MLDQEKIKLNLKALNPKVTQDIWKNDLTQKPNSTEDSCENMETSTPTTQENIQEISQIRKEWNKETIKQKISFADIKKQIDEKNEPEIGENKIPETVPSQDQGETIDSINNIASDTIKEEQVITATISESEKKDTVKLKNEQKTKESLVKQEEDNTATTQKKISLFSKFWRKKWNIQEKNTVIQGNTWDNENTPVGKIQEEKPKEIEKVHFSNYESHFKKESTHFLKKIQNFKYTPNTRIWLVLGLIGITVFTVASLMIFIPEKHSLEIYKASILNITWINNPQEAIVATKINTTQENTEEKIKLEENNTRTEDIEVVLSDRNETTQKEASKEKLREHLIRRYK